MRQLFLDCDGVMADFDTYAERAFGMPPRMAEEQLGTAEFWRILQSHPDFYYNLPLMPGALELYEAVKHLNPIILTGLPLGDWAEPQKRRWGWKHFPDVNMICCPSKDKRNYMKPGDVLVDDWKRYRDLWEEAGGIFILHKSAAESIDSLSQLFSLEPKEVESASVEVRRCSCGAWICGGCLSCSSDCGCDEPKIPCRCWFEDKQVCDICQGVTGNEIDAPQPKDVESTSVEKCVYFDDIHHGTEGRRKYIYAHVRDANTGELLISATMDYCLKAVEERNWFLVGGKIE